MEIARSNVWARILGFVAGAASLLYVANVVYLGLPYWAEAYEWSKRPRTRTQGVVYDYLHRSLKTMDYWKPHYRAGLWVDFIVPGRGAVRGEARMHLEDSSLQHFRIGDFVEIEYADDDPTDIRMLQLQKRASADARKGS